jgi:DNA-directed RNA polymerase omega subunit
MPKKIIEKKVEKKADKKLKAKETEVAEIEEPEVSEDGEGKEKVMHEIDSKYRMILLAAQRSKQLQKGATVRVSVDPRKHKPTYVALQEIKEAKVPFEFLEEEV